MKENHRAPRPQKLIAVVGTHTEVGKTWFAQQLLAFARTQNFSVAARKPAQSFDELPELLLSKEEDGKNVTQSLTDAERLSNVTGEPSHAICPAHRWYAVAMAPPMAADVLHRPKIQLRDLVTEMNWPEVEFGLLETAGGVYSPIAHDGDNLDLLSLVAPDRVVLVADAGLGTLNAVRLCLHAIGRKYLVSVFLNRFAASNDLHRRNRNWLQENYGIDSIVDIETAWAKLQ